MSNLSKEQVKADYAKAIEVLFGGVVQASPDDITEQVIQDVDKMIGEIANCSTNIAKIGIDIIYKATIGRAVDAVTGYFDNILIDTLLDEAKAMFKIKLRNCLVLG